jgi:hypothetical protein
MKIRKQHHKMNLTLILLKNLTLMKRVVLQIVNGRQNQYKIGFYAMAVVKFGITWFVLVLKLRK